MNEIESCIDVNFNKKCAEVFYQSFENFSIICTQCDLKSFKFEDFLTHFKKLHCSDENKSTCIAVKSEKEEEHDAILDILHEEPIEVVCNAEIQAFMDTDIKEENNYKDESDKLGTTTDSENDNIPLKLLFRKDTKRSKSTKSVTCQICKIAYKSRKSLLRHKRSKHELDDSFKCPWCSKSYKHKDTLQVHMQKKHEEKHEKPRTYACTSCDKAYTDKYTLKHHMLRHTGRRTIICDAPDCNLAFYDIKSMNSHKRNVHIGLKNFVCEMCGFCTKTPASLNMHKRTHTGEKPFSCSICGKAFKTPSAVIEHKAMHSTERPHVCDVCGKTFASPKALYHHKPLHLGVKKFICKICGKGYAQAAGLSAHKRQHMLETMGENTQNSLKKI